MTRLSSTNTNVTQTAVGSATPITSPPGTNFTNYVQRNDNITQSLSIGTDPRFLFANPVYGSVTSASSDALGGPTNFFFTSPADILPTTSSYLLLPTDRLVFGIEADVNTVLPTASYDGGHDNTFLSQTGSFFKILNNEAQVVLYGSLIQNEAAKTHNSINQQLVSPSVHEIITNVQDDSDQFLIEERERYTLGYLDNFIKSNKLESCVAAPKTKENVVALIKAADPFNIRSTPSYLINGVKIEGVLPADQMYAILHEILKSSAKH